MIPTNETSITLRARILPLALKLHRKLSEKYEDTNGLYGPDEYPFTWEARELVPFYPAYRLLAGLRLLSYPRYRYVQGQAYWIIANLFLYKEMRDTRYLESAVASGRQLVISQNPDGSWTNPLPGWKERISTVYCSWGGLALVKLYNATRDDRYLAAAMSWKRCMLQKVGTCHTVVQGKDLEFIQYFYPTRADACPNVSTLALAFLSNLTPHLTQRDRQLMSTLLTSVGTIQLVTGEIPYTDHRVHYQCQSYNAFELVDLFEYARHQDSGEAARILKGIADFLSQGVSQEGQVGYSCSSEYPELSYHTLIVAAALHYSYLLFGDLAYANARNRIIARIVRGSGWMPMIHGVSKFGPVKVQDRAFFARQATYGLVSMLRIALIPQMEFRNGTVL